MKEWEEDKLEELIRANKDKFDVYQPDSGHQKQFLRKLFNKFREVISIVPYLVKVGVATVLIFIISISVWKMFICPPLTHISLKYWKVEHSYRYQIQIDKRLIYSDIDNPEDSVRFGAELQKYDDSYETLKIQLKKNPSTDNILNMLGFYKEELLALEGEIQNYRNKKH